MNQMLYNGSCPNLADLVERVLSVSTGVFEVVVGRERPVDVSRYGTVLRRLLGERHRGTEREREREEGVRGRGRRERGGEEGDRDMQRKERQRERGRGRERRVGEGEGGERERKGKKKDM